MHSNIIPTFSWHLQNCVYVCFLYLLTVISYDIGRDFAICLLGSVPVKCLKFNQKKIISSITIVTTTYRNYKTFYDPSKIIFAIAFRLPTHCVLYLLLKTDTGHLGYLNLKHKCERKYNQ